MRKIIFSSVTLAAAFALLLAAPAPADAVKPAGAVTGKALNVEGNVIDGANIRLFANEAQPATQPSSLDAPAKPAKPAKPKGTPVAQTKTAADGTFKLEGVTPGDYIITANSKGNGNDRQAIKITDGQTVEVTLNLKMEPKKPAAAQ